MNENKFVIWLKATGHKIKENIVPIVVYIIPGVIIGGSVTALHDSRRITKLEQRLGAHIKTGNENVDALNKFAEETNKQIEELTRQNNILMEKALQQTEGKAS